MRIRRHRVISRGYGEAGLRQLRWMTLVRVDCWRCARARAARGMVNGERNSAYEDVRAIG